MSDLYVAGHVSKDALLKGLRRRLLNGPPNSGKTGSLWTLPGPLAVLTAPGEKGYTAVPLRTRDGHPVKHWHVEIDASEYSKIPWRPLANGYYKLSREVLSGQHGKFASVAFDGIHKFLNTILMSNCNGDMDTVDEKKRGGVYGTTNDEFIRWLLMVLASSVENIVCTVWDEPEKVNPLDTSAQAKKHMLPALYGKLAMRVMGEFGCVLATSKIGSGDGAEFRWRPKTSGDIQGAGIKLPVEIMKAIKLPDLMPQDFQKLDDLLVKEVSRVWDEIHKPIEGGAK